MQKYTAPPRGGAYADALLMPYRSPFPLTLNGRSARHPLPLTPAHIIAYRRPGRILFRIGFQFETPDRILIRRRAAVDGPCGPGGILDQEEFPSPTAPLAVGVRGLDHDLGKLQRQHFTNQRLTTRWAPATTRGRTVLPDRRCRPAVHSMGQVSESTSQRWRSGNGPPLPPKRTAVETMSLVTSTKNSFDRCTGVSLDVS